MKGDNMHRFRPDKDIIHQVEVYDDITHEWVKSGPLMTLRDAQVKAWQWHLKGWDVRVINTINQKEM
jgi:hypothetical protein